VPPAREHLRDGLSVGPARSIRYEGEFTVESRPAEADLARGFARRKAASDQGQSCLHFLPVERPATRALAAGARGSDAVPVRSAMSRRSKCAMAPNTWNTSSPAAEAVSNRSSRLSRAMPRSFSTHGGQQFGERPPQPVEPHDGQRVAAPRVVEQGGEARPVHRVAGANVGEHPDRAGLAQPQLLPGDVLVTGGHPRIAQDVAHGVAEPLVLWTACAPPRSTIRNRPQTTSPKSDASTIMMDVWGTEGMLWRDDNC
jgi:hypothetical protein